MALTDCTTTGALPRVCVLGCAALNDTAILVHSEDHHAFPGIHHKELSLEGLELTDYSLSKAGLKFGALGTMQTLDSPSETCTTLSTASTITASPLDQKHRYHMLFAYHPNDSAWVKRVVEKLEGEPYKFRCCFPERDYDKQVTRVQNALCSIMLSQRIIVVLSPVFIEESWSEYEESLSHLTSLSQRRQRVVPLVLEECSIPESLRAIQPIEMDHGLMDWEALFQSLELNGFPCSESLHTIKSYTSQSSGYTNGYVLAKLSTKVHGFWKSKLLFDYEEVPDSLAAQEINLSRQDYADIVKVVGREERGSTLPWLFSALPTVLLGCAFVLWCIAFILIILLFPDDEQSTLPVRLCVFSLPPIFIVVSCVLKWRRLKEHMEKYAMCMFSRTVQVNQMLYKKSKPVIVTSARTRDDTFHECIKLFLTHCTDEDIIKLNKVIEVYTLNSGYLDGCPLAVRLAVMLSSAYAINCIFKRIPHSLEQRHTRRRQCLCQFVEEFLAAYLPCIRQEADLSNVKYVFFQYLNCQIKPDPMVLHTLGLMLADA